MLVVIEKNEKERFEFEMDEEFKFLLGMCSFHIDRGYVSTNINSSNLHLFANYGYKLRQRVSLHRILFELHNNRKLENGEHIDHMDTCRTNNKIVNLRAVSNSENPRNRKLREGQIYYNIHYTKNDNYFKFEHMDKGQKIQRNFRSLHEALTFFLDYDKKHDYVLTKHIHDIQPMDGIEDIILTPDGNCEKCDHLFWSKANLKTHQKNKCSN